MRTIILGAALAAITASTALAADIGAKPMPTYAPALSAYNFTGFYAGVNIGGAFAHATTTDINGGVPPGPYSFSPKGVMGGVHGGFNYQWQNNIVAGLEADVGYIDATNGKGYIASSTPGFHQDITLGGGAYVDLTGRLGYALGNVMFYGKGGYAYADLSAKQATTKPGYSPTGTGAYNGIVYGGGVEWLFTPAWSVKAEYLHFDLGSRDGKQTSLTDAPIGYQYVNSTKLDIDTVKVGLSYRFAY